MWNDELIQKLSQDIFQRYDADADGFLRHREYEQYCKDIYFCLELSLDEWNEQCDGLGSERAQGVGLDEFAKLYTEFGRDVVADAALVFKARDFKDRYGSSLLRMGMLLSHIFA